MEPPFPPHFLVTAEGKTHTAGREVQDQEAEISDESLVALAGPPSLRECQQPSLENLLWVSTAVPMRLIIVVRLK